MNLERANSISGWMYPDELQFLAQVAKKSTAILEIGCYKGRSTRALADNISPIGHIIALDPWRGPYYSNDGSVHGIDPNVFPEFAANLREHIDSGLVTPYPFYSTEFLHLWQLNSLPKFDFIFIDGDHRAHMVDHDIQLARRIATKNAIIAGHDYSHSDWPGVKEVVDQRFPNAEHVASIWWVNNADYTENFDWCGGR